MNLRWTAGLPCNITGPAQAAKPMLQSTVDRLLMLRIMSDGLLIKLSDNLSIVM